MNVCVFAGNLTADPIIRTLDNGKKTATFDIAVRPARKDGETLYIRVSAWDKLAEIAASYLKKGKKAGVAGRLEKPYLYTNKNTGQPGATLQLTAEKLEILSSPNEQPNTPPLPNTGYAKQYDQGGGFRPNSDPTDGGWVDVGNDFPGFPY